MMLPEITCMRFSRNRVRRLRLATLWILCLPAFAITPVGPAKFGSPDQTWGTRRAITAADRALVAKYRSSKMHPAFSDDFKSAADLDAHWTAQTDDKSDLQSCRLAANNVPSSAGLRLETHNTTECKHSRFSTGAIISKDTYGYGFYEASIQAAATTGINNAFWLTTVDKWEIDVTEIHYPSQSRMTLHNWATSAGTAVGFYQDFSDHLAAGFHDYGVVWTPQEIVYEVDGTPIAAIATHGSVHGQMNIRFSTALMTYAGPIPADPAGKEMIVRSVKYLPL
jgi:beta-glucanase (GH16 family)